MFAGTGYYAAKALLAKGAHVIVLNRASERADTALRSLEDESGNDGRLVSIPCDLLCFDSVRDAGTAVVAVVDEHGEGLDGLVCNAGAALHKHAQSGSQDLAASMSLEWTASQPRKQLIRIIRTNMPPTCTDDLNRCSSSFVDSSSRSSVCNCMSTTRLAGMQASWLFQTAQLWMAMMFRCRPTTSPISC